MPQPPARTPPADRTIVGPQANMHLRKSSKQTVRLAVRARPGPVRCAAMRSLHDDTGGGQGLVPDTRSALAEYCEYNAGGTAVKEGMNPQIGPHLPLDDLAEYIRKELKGLRA